MQAATGRHPEFDGLARQIKRPIRPPDEGGNNRSGGEQKQGDKAKHETHGNSRAEIGSCRSETARQGASGGWQNGRYNSPNLKEPPMNPNWRSFLESAEANFAADATDVLDF
ncbi:MAG TPA: hypothetical protein PLN02_06250, partial [Azonexus sp.]|nr:hypothetical protein [Azonexus sp.]